MKKIQVTESKIHGRGLVAVVNIQKSEFVGHIKGETKFKINKSIQDTFAHPDWVGFKKNYWTDPLPPFKYINHSCEPNCGIKGRKTVCALRNINSGEELTIDYSTTEIDTNWVLECTCGSKICRRKIQSIQSLPLSAFKKYAPLIPTAFKKMYTDLKSNQAKKS